MFLRLLIVADAYEEQVALVVVQGLAVVFVLDLLQGTFRTFVMLQFDDQGRDIRQIRNQYQVCVTFARRQFLHQCVAYISFLRLCFNASAFGFRYKPIVFFFTKIEFIWDFTLIA